MVNNKYKETSGVNQSSFHGEKQFIPLGKSSCCDSHCLQVQENLAPAYVASRLLSHSSQLTTVFLKRLIMPTLRGITSPECLHGDEGAALRQLMFASRREAAFHLNSHPAKEMSWYLACIVKNYWDHTSNLGAKPTFGPKRIFRSTCNLDSLAPIWLPLAREFCFLSALFSALYRRTEIATTPIRPTCAWTRILRSGRGKRRLYGCMTSSRESKSSDIIPISISRWWVGPSLHSFVWGNESEGGFDSFEPLRLRQHLTVAMVRRHDKRIALFRLFSVEHVTYYKLHYGVYWY